ncbi:4077_t:CDS:2 [Ambispora gerdemannii]|uniref:4077_t:CDS:1 n=1 Tax=Ambispora gerdemannii TaxID=144530 RepID=A0A9N8ZGP3_9GLOM|nr:4077_t:CDS:2 [Ambispora gerdemannii]
MLITSPPPSPPLSPKKGFSRFPAHELLSDIGLDINFKRPEKKSRYPREHQNGRKAQGENQNNVSTQQTTTFRSHPQPHAANQSVPKLPSALETHEDKKLQKSAIWDERKFVRTVVRLGMLLQGIHDKAPANIIDAIDEALIAREEVIRRNVESNANQQEIHVEPFLCHPSPQSADACRISSQARYRYGRALWRLILLRLVVGVATFKKSEC